MSIIIPHRATPHLLSRMLNSIPESDLIEVIVVDNSIIPIEKSNIETVRSFELLFSDIKRGAGGARNVGIENAHGKWLIFADADDYFTENAFECFFRHSISEADILYFFNTSIDTITGQPASRGESITKILRGYLDGKTDEDRVRLCIPQPWPKMFSSDFIKQHNIRFDEVVASNDTYFSMLAGYYANKIEVVDKVVYVATFNTDSLTRRRDREVLESRFRVKLRYNQFVKSHDKSSYQKSIMYELSRSIHFGFGAFFRFGYLIMKYHQNPFIGFSNWVHTYKSDSSV